MEENKYCSKCGSPLNENGVCPSCGASKEKEQIKKNSDEEFDLLLSSLKSLNQQAETNEASNEQVAAGTDVDDEVEVTKEMPKKNKKIIAPIVLLSVYILFTLIFFRSALYNLIMPVAFLVYVALYNKKKLPVIPTACIGVYFILMVILLGSRYQFADMIVRKATSPMGVQFKYSLFGIPYFYYNQAFCRFFSTSNVPFFTEYFPRNMAICYFLSCGALALPLVSLWLKRPIKALNIVYYVLFGIGSLICVYLFVMLTNDGSGYNRFITLNAIMRVFILPILFILSTVFTFKVRD